METGHLYGTCFLTFFRYGTIKKSLIHSYSSAKDDLTLLYIYILFNKRTGSKYNKQKLNLTKKGY